MEDLDSRGTEGLRRGRRRQGRREDPVRHQEESVRRDDREELLRTGCVGLSLRSLPSRGHTHALMYRIGVNRRTLRHLRRPGCQSWTREAELRDRDAHARR